MLVLLRIDTFSRFLKANIGDILALNYEYLMTLPQPVKPWGQLPPHTCVPLLISFLFTHSRHWH